jgi:hypothetical protein
LGVYAKICDDQQAKEQNGLCALSLDALFGWGRPPPVKSAVRRANVEGIGIKSIAGPLCHLFVIRA